MTTAEEVARERARLVEIGIKVRTGKLRIPDGLRELVHDRRIVALTAEHGLALAGLPLHHRDPFDRRLITQAMAERQTMASSDAEIARYDVPVIDASA